VRAPALIVPALFLTASLVSGCDDGTSPSGEAPKVEAPKAPDVGPAAEAPAPDPAAAKPVAAAAPDPNEACARGIVVGWKGLEGAEEDITRDKAAAQARAEQLLDRAKSGEAIASLAAESDEARSQRKRGGLGTYVREKWPERYGPLADPLYAAAIEGFTDVVETPLGFAFAQRCAVDKVDTSHILIRYGGADRAPEDLKRTKDEARALAQEVRDKAAADGADFAALAGEYGEDGTAKKGGALGPIGRGMFVPEYEDVAWAMNPGELSEVVEGPFGFHVILRAPK
jgi:hypothetical protein